MKFDLPDISSNFLGFSCCQCQQTFIYIQGALMHQCKINDAGGTCPDAEVKETASYSEGNDT